MYTLILVLIFIVCVLLVLIVLVQNSKGADWQVISRHPPRLQVFARRPIFWKRPHGHWQGLCCCWPLWDRPLFPVIVQVLINQWSRNRSAMLSIPTRFPYFRPQSRKKTAEILEIDIFPDQLWRGCHVTRMAAFSIDTGT